MNVESVNIQTLPSLPLPDRRSLPDCVAVYFVLNPNNEILYIGRAKNLAQRWDNHHRLSQLLEMGDDIRVAWLECSEPTLLSQIEAALIKHFQPYLNYNPQVKGGAPRYKQQGIETATVGVVLPKEVKVHLDKVAKSRGWSISQTAAVAIKEWLEQQEPASNDKEDAA